MSKMSDIQLDLTEQANNLGFEDIEEAEANGYKVDYNGDEWTLRPDVDKAYEERHKEWEKERDEVLSIIESVKEDIVELNGGNNEHVAIDELNRVIDFVEGCHD